MAGMFPLGTQQPPAPGMFSLGQDPYAPSPFRQNINKMASGLFSIGQQSFQQPFDRQRIEQSMLERAKADLDPFYAQATRDFEQSMSNQGVDIGTPRYQREKELFLKGRDTAYNDARFRAMQAGGEEQSRYLQDMNALLGSGAQYAGLESAEGIARRGQDVTMRGQDISSSDTQRGQDVQRYGIDTQASTAREGIASTERISQAEIGSREKIADLDATVRRQGYASNEKIADARNLLDRELQDGRIGFEKWQTEFDKTTNIELENIRNANSQQLQQMENDANKQLQSLSQQWQEAEKTKDRDLQKFLESKARATQIKIAQIGSRRSGGGGSGGKAQSPYADGSGYSPEADLNLALS